MCLSILLYLLYLQPYYLLSAAEIGDVVTYLFIPELEAGIIAYFA